MVDEAQAQLDRSGEQAVPEPVQQEDGEEWNSHNHQTQQGYPQTQGEAQMPAVKALYGHVRHPVAPVPCGLQ